MNMKKLALIATLGALALFTACGDDESDSTVSCTFKAGSMKFCAETENYPGASTECTNQDGDFGSSCPSGEQKKCELEEETYMFIYAEDSYDIAQLNSISCNDIQRMMGL